MLADLALPAAVPADQVVITLPPQLDLASVRWVQDDLAAALADARPLKLLADQVTTLTTPGVQILIACARARAAAGLRFVVMRPSDAFVAAFDDLGLFGELRAWEFEE